MFFAVHYRGVVEGVGINCTDPDLVEVSGLNNNNASNNNNSNI